VKLPCRKPSQRIWPRAPRELCSIAACDRRHIPMPAKPHTVMIGYLCRGNCGCDPRGFKLFVLKWTSKLVVFLVALSVWASPLMACMLPDATLTQEERECCRQMAGDCGEMNMDMPASHSCCKVTMRDLDPYLINSRACGVQFHPTVILPHQTAGISLPQTFSQAEFAMAVHSPPVSPPEDSSILRI
jgi:hypothetical protein